MSAVDKGSERMIPLKERRRLRNLRIRSMHRDGYSYNEICKALGVSKMTVFFAMNEHKSKNKINPKTKK